MGNPAYRSAVRWGDVEKAYLDGLSNYELKNRFFGIHLYFLKFVAETDKA